MQGMILTVLSSAAGSAAGCILSLYLGRPGKRAKVDPFSKRILPLCAGFFLMALAIPAAPGILKLILSVFFSSFTLTGLGTAKGLEDRDQDLLEMAYVFFIPDKSRITYIDLPACRDKLVLSATRPFSYDRRACILHHRFGSSLCGRQYSQYPPSDRSRHSPSCTGCLG